MKPQASQVEEIRDEAMKDRDPDEAKMYLDITLEEVIGRVVELETERIKRGLPGLWSNRPLD